MAIILTLPNRECAAIPLPVREELLHATDRDLQGLCVEIVAILVTRKLATVTIGPHKDDLPSMQAAKQ